MEAQIHKISGETGTAYFEAKWSTQTLTALTAEQWKEIDDYIEAKITEWKKRETK